MAVSCERNENSLLRKLRVTAARTRENVLYFYFLPITNPSFRADPVSYIVIGIGILSCVICIWEWREGELGLDGTLVHLANTSCHRKRVDNGLYCWLYSA